jgi:CheY-like chemotaxis protein
MPEPNEFTILIAEDEESNYKYLEAVLKDKGITKIIWSKNGVEAVNAVEKQTIDLIFMDLKMPEMDGLEATKKIKKINKKIPVLALTAFADTYDIRKAKKAGCNDYIYKPISMKMVSDKITQYLKI